MNFKKFISSISAVTIAASAFAGMAVTASATETKSTIYENDFENGYDFTTNGTAKKFILGEYSTANTKASKIAGVNTGTNDGNITSPSLSGLETYANAKIVDVSFDFKFDACAENRTNNIALLGGTSSSNWLNSTQQILTISANSKTSYGNGYFGTLTINNTDYLTNIGIESAKDEEPNLNRDTTGWATLKARIDFTAQQVTFSVEKNGATVVESTTADFVNTNVAALDRIFVYASRSYGGTYIDNVKVEKVTADITYYDYTVNYVCNEKTVSSVSGQLAADTVVTAETSVTDSDGALYYLDADTAPSMTISATGDNILNVPVRAAYIYNMKAVASTNSAELASASVVEGKTFSYTYPKYLTDENNKVIATSDNTSYSATMTPEKSEDISVPYTVYAGNDLYFYEGENFGGDGTAVNDARLSGGKAIRHISESRGSYKSVKIPVAESGVYEVTICGVTNSSGKGSLEVYKNSTSSTALQVIDISNNTVNKILTEKLTDTVQLKAGDQIIIKGEEDNSALDYVLLKKTGEYVPEAPSVSTVESVAVASDVENDNVMAKAFKFTASANDGSISNVVITVDGSVEESKTFTTPEIAADGNAVFGIIFATNNENVTLPDADAIHITLN